jgi:hypothetical protein
MSKTNSFNDDILYANGALKQNGILTNENKTTFTYQYLGENQHTIFKSLVTQHLKDRNLLNGEEGEIEVIVYITYVDSDNYDDMHGDIEDFNIKNFLITPVKITIIIENNEIKSIDQFCYKINENGERVLTKKVENIENNEYISVNIIHHDFINTKLKENLTITTMANCKAFNVIFYENEEKQDTTEEQAGGKRKSKGKSKKVSKKPVVSQKKQSIYKEILGKQMKIYKMPDSRKEYVKYKGELHSISDYKNLMKQKANAKPKAKTKPKATQQKAIAKTKTKK